MSQGWKRLERWFWLLFLLLVPILIGATLLANMMREATNPGR